MKMNNICIGALSLLLMAGTASTGLCAKDNGKGGRERIQLNGTWHSTLGDCRLPGIPDKASGAAGLGSGRQWILYHRTVSVPSSFAGRRLRLVLERAGESTLWVDGDSIGRFRHPSLPHVYDLPALSGDKVEVALKTSGAIYGDMYIEACDSTYISGLEVMPDMSSGMADVHISVDAAYSGRAYIRLGVNRMEVSSKEAADDVLQYEVYLSKGRNDFRYRMEIADSVALWSEFHPDLYRLSAALSASGSSDKAECVFGVRDILVEGGAMHVNGNRVFLRGKRYSGASKEGRKQMKEWWWRMMFSKAAESGVNYWHIDSYSLPEAAFAAADREGVYISSMDSSIGRRHPSFIPSAAGVDMLWIGRKDASADYMDNIEEAMNEDYGGFLLPDIALSDIKAAALMPLALHGREVFERGDTLDVMVGVANYTESGWQGQVEWSVAADELRPVTKETLPAFKGRIDCTAGQGKTERAGRVFLPLSMLGLKEGETCRLTLTLSIGDFKSIYIFRAGSVESPASAE